jgi:hypothetical protein
MLVSKLASCLRPRLVAALRHRFVALLLSFGALALGGCKQDVGGRCEQNSDCASGICGNGQGGATSAMGRQCAATLGGPAVTPDASSTTDAAVDAGGGAVDASSSEASGDVSSPDASQAGEAGAEASHDDGAPGAEASQADGATGVEASQADGATDAEADTGG